MKNLFLVTVTSSLFWLTACDSPGTLGAVGEIDLNCSSIDVGQRVDVLLEINPYEVKAKDTAVVNWWKDGGYGFLTYRCINIRKRLYMITIDSDSPTESNISVRAYYDRNRKTWVFANKFASTDNYRAEKALDYLSNEMSTCL